MLPQAPEQTATADQIAERLSALAADEVHITATATFVVRRTDLPSHSVVSLLLNVTAGTPSSGVCLTGSRFRVTDGDVNRIEWNLRRRNEEEIIVTDIRARLPLSMNDDYLNSLVASMHTAFRAFILDQQAAMNEVQQ